MAKSSDAQMNSALAQLRQACQRVWSLGDLRSLREALPTGAQREALDDALLKVDVRARYLRDAIADKVAAEGFSVAHFGPELWRFYEKEFLPNAEAFHALYSDSFFAGLDLSDALDGLQVKSSEASPPADERQVDTAFSIGITLVRDKFEDNMPWWGIDDDAVRSAERIQSAPFFTPEEWNRNLAELRPIVSGRPLNKYPGHVQVRLREIGRSFIFGNWLAVLALCRSLLEYALIDRATTRGIDAFEAINGIRRSKRLADLIDEVSEGAPELSLPMATIRELGNHVMHPSKHYDVIRFPEIMRSNSVQVVEAIRSVVESLYA